VFTAINLAIVPLQGGKVNKNIDAKIENSDVNRNGIEWMVAIMEV